MRTILEENSMIMTNDRYGIHSQNRKPIHLEHRMYPD